MYVHINGNQEIYCTQRYNFLACSSASANLFEWLPEYSSKLPFHTGL